MKITRDNRDEITRYACYYKFYKINHELFVGYFFTRRALKNKRNCQARNFIPDIYYYRLFVSSSNVLRRLQSPCTCA